MVFTQNQETEKIVETSENLRLIRLAQERRKNGRVGDRALQTLIEQQTANINSAIQKRLVQLPFLDEEELRFSAIEGIITRLESYDPMEGCQFSSWAYFGILNGIDAVARLELKNYKAQLEVQFTAQPYSEDFHPDTEFIQLIQEKISCLPETVQEIISLVLQGWKYTEIGEQLGKSADAVRMAYNRGIEKVQCWLSAPVIRRPKARLKLTRGWLKTQLSKVVRKFAQLRIQERTLSLQERTSMNSTTNRTCPEHGKIPLAFFQSEAGQKRYQSLPKWRLTPKGKLFFTVLAGTLLAFIAHQTPLHAQCTGWLCGGRDAILANEMWGADTPDAAVIVNGIFLALQFVAALLIAVPLLIAAALGIRREDYAPYFIGSAIIFIALIAINFMVGWLFGV